MILGMSIPTFTLVHVLISLVGILAGLAPTQSEPPFVVAQGIVLLLLIALGVFAVRRFHPQAAA